MKIEIIKYDSVIGSVFYTVGSDNSSEMLVLLIDLLKQGYQLKLADKQPAELSLLSTQLGA